MTDEKSPNVYCVLELATPMNELFVAVAVILFPGLISAVICDKITVHASKWDHFKFAVYAFIFGVTCYLLIQVAVYAWAVARWITCGSEGWPDTRLRVWSIVTSQERDIALAEVFWATVVSPVVAGLAAWSANSKLLTSIAAQLSISNKYGDENLFTYVLNSPDTDWVYVRDIATKLTYQGRVGSFSEANDLQEIVLYDVTVYGYEDSDEYYSVPFVYLSKARGDFVIEAIPREKFGV